MDMKELPLFWLAYLSDPSDSGRIHSNIRQRWLSGTYLRLRESEDTFSRKQSLIWWASFCPFPGEPLVVDAMRTFAELTDQARLVRALVNVIQRAFSVKDKRKEKKMLKKGISVHILRVASLTNGIKYLWDPESVTKTNSW